MQMLIHHPAACLIAFLSLVALMFVANQLGLIAWIAWLDYREEDYREEDRREEDRREDDRREDSATANPLENIGGYTSEKSGGRENGFALWPGPRDCTVLMPCTGEIPT